ncbi:Long chain acyl-CoA synthetase 4 [Glycine soja]|uniref:Long chain acyl-CoA synthetase 4 n=1 Tax=Glycine soja TaxID=3848 RepID=A0A445J8S6_GLYSO|nr:Long chain acyl-CoA synthetase 4 [Glycine soja]
MAEKRFIVKVEKATEAREGKPPIGPVYRSIFAHDPLPPPIQEQGHNQSFDLPVKKKSDVCTIMYTSGTTGDPKGVLITNESIITLLAGIQQLLKSCNEKLNEKDVYLSYLPLAHIFARVIEEAMIMHGASIGFWSGDVSVTGRYWRAKANHFCCGSPCAR